MRYQSKTFEEQPVDLDANEFVGCTFNRCLMRYAGGPSTLDGNVFNDCEWALVGPAANAVDLLTTLYAQGGAARRIVEGTIENIRKGGPAEGRLSGSMNKH